MADFLTAVKSVRTQAKSNESESLLTAVTSTASPIPTSFGSDAAKVLRPDQPLTIRTLQKVASPHEALNILRLQPDLDQVVLVLKQLRQNDFSDGLVDLHAPGPLQAQIINTLLSTTLADFWPGFNKVQRSEFVVCLQNVAGFSAVISHLRLLASQTQPRDTRSNAQAVDLLQVVHQLCSGDDVVVDIWHGLQNAVSDEIKRNLTWKQLTSLLASGKVISTVAQTEDGLKGAASRPNWLANGGEYAEWLGRNIATLAAHTSKSDDISAAAQLLTKSLNLGHPNLLLRGLFGGLVSDHKDKNHASTRIPTLLHDLAAHTKRTLTEQTLRWLSSADEHDMEDPPPLASVTAKSGLLSALAQDETIRDCIISVLLDQNISTTLSLSVRRACMAVVSRIDGTDHLYRLLEALFAAFCDRLFIDHAAVRQQESLIQTLLLASGHLHRQKPVAFLVVGRSSNALQGVSHRLDSTNARARWLGMIVATAVSRLVDKESSRMNFGTDEMDTAEARRYLGLVDVADEIGDLRGFAEMLKLQKQQVISVKTARRRLKTEEPRKVNGKPVFGPPRPPAQTEIIGDQITEILDDDGSEDDDMKPYAKPDSDPEDSDEDATLVNRHKTRAPVYIRDLMAMLRDDKSHDRFQMGIQHAASLIRRKSNFGAEVKDHAEELAGMFCNLQDPFETEAFDEFKLQALIAILLADVHTMAPWLSKQAFAGEYSLAQRCIMLSALGLGGRELAGLELNDELNPSVPNTNFPSKQLPPRLHAIYKGTAASTKRLDSASTDMQRALLQPLALQAADQSTSHLNAVKVRTFSSRMETERTKRKPKPNQLAKIFGAAFFLPLANRYQQEIAAYGPASVYSSAPIVLVTFLKTLALLLHASGPATLDLPQITAEFWDLLLSLRVRAINDITILQAVLFSLLTLLEMSTDKRRIADELPRQLMETQQWVDMVFDRTGGGGYIVEDGNNDEAKIRTLAAGVLVKTREIIDAYQKQLVGYTQ